LGKKLILLLFVLFLILIPFFPWSARAQELSPEEEQEFADAKLALEAARKAQAERYALEPFRKAQDLLVKANDARNLKDPVRFTQASRLARAYAELAKTIAELKSEEEKLAAANEELRKTKAEIERLKKSH